MGDHVILLTYHGDAVYAVRPFVGHDRQRKRLADMHRQIGVPDLCLHDRGGLFPYKKSKEICRKIAPVCRDLRDSVQFGNGEPSDLPDTSECAVEFFDRHRADPME